MVSFAIVAVLWSLRIVTCLAGADIKSHFDLPAEPLDKALRDFAIQANCNISYEPSIVAGLRAPAVKGEYLPKDVLSMILAGTKLQALNVDDDTVLVVERTISASHDRRDDGKADDARNSSIVRIAYTQADGPPTGSPAASDSVASDIDVNDARDSGKRLLEEITVTGTHIRGVTDSASPTQIYTRADIDASGASTVQQFVQTLPQNFGGGASEATIGNVTGGGNTYNGVGGAGVNLRGLGPDATLVLLNGHRIASGNLTGNFVDISMIPLSAVERIEVVTDGASAIYGSDAVGGVVNFILRQNFEGAETRARFGEVTEGSSHETQAGQVLGHAWGSGSALLSYDYYDRTPLNSLDRRYTETATQPFTLLGENTRNSVIVNLNQTVLNRIQLFADGNYSHRSNEYNQSTADAYQDGSPSFIDTEGAVFGGRASLFGQTEIEMSGSYAGSHTDDYTFQVGEAAPIVHEKTSSKIISADGKLDGPLGSVPAGTIRFAIGTQFRKESLDEIYLSSAGDSARLSRDVLAEFAELRVPILGRDDDSEGGDRLELSLAGRHEHYSDFGSTTNPQVGLIWRATDEFRFRGTYGKSFKAPLLDNLNPVSQLVIPYPESDPRTGGTTNVLIVQGGNPNLRPETAKTWTVGLDFQARSIPGLTFKGTYFDIEYSNRIVSIDGSGFNSFDALISEPILGPAIIQRNPSNSVIQQFINSTSYYTNPYDIDPATIGAIVDGRYINVSSVRTTGADFDLKYKRQVTFGTVELGASGVRILKFDTQFNDASPAASLLNTPYNPVDLKVRGKAGLTWNGVTATAFINYTAPYTDNRTATVAHVASWTTFDTTVSYEWGHDSSVLADSSIAFSVINATNKEPPFVANFYNINYDGANANALGRFLSLQLTKRW